MASDTHRSIDFHVHVKPISIGDETFWSYTFPTEPHWWPDEAKTKRRAGVVQDFRFEDLENLTTELKQLVEYPLRLGRRPENTKDAEAGNREDAAQLARRCLSLSWLSSVAFEHLNGLGVFDGLEYHLRLNQIRTAQLLAETAWWLLLDLPRPLVAAGIIEAVARPDEIHQAEDNTWS